MTVRFPVLRLLGALAPYWRRLLPAAVATVVAELAAVALMGTAAWLVARASQRPELVTLALAIVVVRALALGRGVLRYVDRLLGHDAVLAAVAGLRARVYEALIPLAPSGAQAFRSGDLLARLVDDVDAGQDLLLRCALPTVVAGTVGITAVGLAGALLPTAAVVLALGLLVSGLLVPAVTFVCTRRVGDTERTVRGELTSATVDLTRGAADLLAFGADGAHSARAAQLAGALARVERRRAAGTGLATAIVVLVQGLTTVAVSFVAVRANAAGELSAVLVVVLAVLALTVFEVVNPLPAAARRFAEIRSSARRLAALFGAPAPVPEPAGEARVTGGSSAVIELTGLRARYPGARSPALDGVDLRLEPGRRVAVVGTSGSGKSTLLAVLMRFLGHEGGRARLGDRDLRDLSGDDAHRVITGVTQDAHVFHADIRANLVLAKPDATEDEIQAAAGRARLSSWVESLPAGWATVVGEDGGSMSGGQRQRLLLARALLADPPVLVLDEPTEGLEPATADEVLADVLDATRGRTTLLVTHRPAGLEAVDEVVVLDRGRVVMRGTHRDLLAEPGYIGAVLR